VPNQSKKTGVERNTDRRNGKPFKKDPIKPCSREDHVVKGACKRHPGRTTDGYSTEGFTRKAHKQSSYQAKAMAGS
jgi:hypothetical protein